MEKMRNDKAYIVLRWENIMGRDEGVDGRIILNRILQK
jgi:hypothetical protein